MAQLNLKLNEDRLEGLRRYAARRRTPVAWLLKDYIDYLLAGGAPVEAVEMSPLDGRELAQLAQTGGAFDWLRNEPEWYSLADGEPV